MRTKPSRQRLRASGHVKAQVIALSLSALSIALLLALAMLSWLRRAT